MTKKKASKPKSYLVYDTENTDLLLLYTETELEGYLEDIVKDNSINAIESLVEDKIIRIFKIEKELELNLKIEKTISVH